jgi:hypothetical protein
MTRTPVASALTTGRRPRAGGRSIDWHCRAFGYGPAVDRTPEAVDHSPEESVGRANFERSAGRLDRIVGPDAGERPERQHDRLASVESDDLGGQRLALPANDDDIADARARERRTNRQAGHCADPADGEHRRRSREARLDFFEIHDDWMLTQKRGRDGFSR